MSGYSPSAVVEATDGTLFVAAASPTTGKPGLFRCKADGTGCTYVELATVTTDVSAQSPKAVIDPASGRLLVVVTNNAKASGLTLLSLAPY